MQNGEAKLMTKPARRTYTTQFKFDVVLEALSGQKPVVQICRERNITEKLLYRWKALFLERAPGVFEVAGQAGADAEAQTRVAELERLVGRLTMELDIAKKVGTLWTSRSTKNGR